MAFSVVRYNRNPPVYIRFLTTGRASFYMEIVRKEKTATTFPQLLQEKQAEISERLQ